jgi:hypothetical protein
MLIVFDLVLVLDFLDSAKRPAFVRRRSIKTNNYITTLTVRGRVRGRDRGRDRFEQEGSPAGLSASES